MGCPLPSASLPSLLSVAAALAMETFEGNAFYVGDPHVHTAVSADATASDVRTCYTTCGSLADVFDTAQAHGLDWVAFTDHVNGSSVHCSSNSAWDAFHARVIDHDDEGTGLLVVPAAEVWLTHGADWYGHRNVYFFGDDALLAGLTMADVQPDDVNTEITCDGIGTWIQAMDDAWGPVLLVPHHPAVNPPASNDWTCAHPTWEVAVEVYSSWGNSLGGDLIYDLPVQPLAPPGFVHQALNPEATHLRLGFLAGTDSHNTLPGDLCGVDSRGFASTGGFTLAVIPESDPFDRPALFAAFVERRTLATTGPALPVTFEVRIDGVVTGTLGEEVTVASEDAVEARVRVPSTLAPFVTDVFAVEPMGSHPLALVDTATWSFTWPPAGAPAWVYAAVRVDGAAWYGGDWCEDGGRDTDEWVWTSPTWIDVLAGDADGDGWEEAAGDCDDADAAVHPEARERWYDGQDANCDGADDFDADADGFKPTWLGGLDCDDFDPRRRPGMPERAGDGIDANCDGKDD